MSVQHVTISPSYRRIILALILLLAPTALAGESKAEDAGSTATADWPEPLVRENGVAGFRTWEDIYARMGMTRQWAEEAPAPGSWETPGLLEQMLDDGPLAGVEEVVFAIRRAGPDWHWYANFGYPSSDAEASYSGNGCRLMVKNLRTGAERVLLDDPAGSLRDPCVDYDGQRILFSYRPGGTPTYHLYTIQADGSGLTQLTDGPYDDIEPTWLPDGDIIFCSSRARRWVPCYKSQVAILYRCRGDGSGVRPVSCNVETENTPWMMPDGRVLFTRWEYVDRDQDLSYHHLWTMNPDGTGVMTYLGNQFSGMLLIGAKPVPGSDKVVSIAAPGHGRNEHTGAVTLIDAGRGPDDLSLSRIVSRPEPDRPVYGWVKDPHRWRDPWALSEACFLVARDRGLYVMDGAGRYEEFYTLPEDFPPPENPGAKDVFMAHEPRPLVARPREPVLSDRTNLENPTGEMLLADVTVGRDMTGITSPKEIRDLLVLEVLPKPINYFGGADIIATWPTYFLYRVLGTVPVEADGSAYFEVPALRPVFFVARDEDGRGIKRMRSFTHVMPGEQLGCVGCHEKRSHTPEKPFTLKLAATGRAPSRIKPLEGMPEVFDFPRDIQPILDRHCTECHGIPQFEGGFSLSGDRGTDYSHAYINLFRLGLVEIRSPVGRHPPRTDGSSASRLLEFFDPSHHQVAPSAEEIRKIATWIDAGAPYAGTYAALGNGMVFYKYPAEKVLQDRCVSCHAPGQEKVDLKKLFPSYALNLTKPEESLMLLAPLTKQAGGLGLCRQRPVSETEDGSAAAPPAGVFASTDDPDFQALQENMQQMADWLQTEITSFEFPTFRPSDGYLRELERFGILPADFDPATGPITPYAWDAAYWQLFHYPQDPAQQP